MKILALAVPSFFSPLQSPPVTAQSPRGVDSASLTTGGLVWSYLVDGVGGQVGLGDRGGQVLVWSQDRELVLFSAFDANPPARIWTAGQEDASSYLVAAKEADVYLHCDVRDNFPEFSAVLKKFTSRSPVPKWRFSFPPQMLLLPSCDVSDDGRTILSAFPLVTQTATMVVNVHDPETGVPLRTWSFSENWVYADLAPDGTVAAVGDAFGEGSSAVIDVASGAVLFRHAGAIPGRQALSSDGRVLALLDATGPGASFLRVFSRTSTGYRPVLEVPAPASFLRWDAAVSDDGSTVVFAYSDPNASPTRAILSAYDVATGTRTMQRIQPAESSWIGPTCVSIAADGSRFVYGFGGNRDASVASLALYRRDSSDPIAEHGDVGPVYGVDMSPDGKRYVASRVEPLSSPPTGNFSRIQLYEVGGEDFVARGRPSVGSTVTFELYGTPGSGAVLLRSFALAPNPIDVPRVGRLYLDPASLVATSMGTIPTSGPPVAAVAIDVLPETIVRTIFYQGLQTSPRSLTHDWVQLTIVP